MESNRIDEHINEGDSQEKQAAELAESTNVEASQEAGSVEASTGETSVSETIVETTTAESNDTAANNVEASSFDGGSVETSNVDAIDDPKSVELSTEFIGRWSNLISTTNWEKGMIISEWREALKGSHAPAAASSDEAWCRRVGGVTPQHVGRLRRVYDRFHDSYETFKGLYWSHFLAALDWDDAEMWLEGATQSQWSVSQMRRTRWEANGQVAAEEPKEADIEVVSSDEDYTPLAEIQEDADIRDDSRNVAEGPRPDGPDFGDESDAAAVATDSEEDDVPWDDANEEQHSPFAKLPSLPVDLAEAVEQFKLAIIRHRSDSWSEVDQADVVRALEALKSFAAL